jgi:dipeptidyl aminopeptidase/acylaminoacyl peptidase
VRDNDYGGTVDINYICLSFLSLFLVIVAGGGRDKSRPCTRASNYTAPSSLLPLLPTIDFCLLSIACCLLPIPQPLHFEPFSFKIALVYIFKHILKLFDNEVNMKKLVFISVSVLFLLLSMHTDIIGQQKPVMPEDLYKIKKVSSPRLSPDGKFIAYTVEVPCIKKNKYNSDIWLIPVNGGSPIQLTDNPASDKSPRWSPDSSKIAFISKRDGKANLFIINIHGGEAKKITNSNTSLSSPIWSKNGKYILCQSRVLPKNKKNIENWTKDKLPECNARTIDHLLFRQWDRWLGDKRNHLFLVNLSDGSMKDLTLADKDVPAVSLDSDHDFDISPDGTEIAFVRNDSPMPAISTNQDVFTLDINSMKETKITANPALDQQPHYSPDGKYIAYTAMQKPGYEADRRRLVIFDRKSKSHIPLTDSLDRSVAQVLWAPNSKSLYFTCRDSGHSSIYNVDLKGNVKLISNEGYNLDINVSPDEKRMVFRRSFNHLPYELFSMPLKRKNNKATQLTFVNKKFLAEFHMPKLEEFRFEGADGDLVHGYIQRPPNFDANKKYPAILTIHGGPQNMWADRFMTSWYTFTLVSSPGYVGVFINPRGSTGYGSKFRAQVSKDYGGRCYEDLMKGMDYVIEKYKFVDQNRLAAIGGSFGGFSVNWLMTHTNRFKCIASHASLYNFTSFYGATEELWFPAWDLGKNPWDEPALYNKYSPHLLANKLKTPTLVTHGEKDYRVPIDQSLQLFTALQRQHIPSRLVIFPDEGHVISNPQNNIRWWKELYRWFEEYLK